MVLSKSRTICMPVLSGFTILTINVALLNVKSLILISPLSRWHFFCRFFHLWNMTYIRCKSYRVTYKIPFCLYIYDDFHFGAPFCFPHRHCFYCWRNIYLINRLILVGLSCHSSREFILISMVDNFLLYFRVPTRTDPVISEVFYFDNSNIWGNLLLSYPNLGISDIWRKNVISLYMRFYDHCPFHFNLTTLISRGPWYKVLLSFSVYFNDANIEGSLFISFFSHFLFHFN